MGIKGGVKGVSSNRQNFSNHFFPGGSKKIRPSVLKDEHQFTMHATFVRRLVINQNLRSDCQVAGAQGVRDGGRHVYDFKFKIH